MEIKVIKINGYTMDTSSQTITSPKGKIVYSESKIFTKSKKGRYSISYLLYMYLNVIKGYDINIHEVETFVKVKVSYADHLKWSKGFTFDY